MSSIGFINFLIAKKNGIKVRIAHSHNSSTDTTLKGKIKRLLMLPYKYVSTKNYACSTEAGKYLFGTKKFEFIPNSVFVDKYLYSENKNKEIRKKYDISQDAIVIGHIGRFNVQKNHMFIIEMFEKLYLQNENSFLLLIGDGELKDTIIKRVSKMSCKNNIIFTGVVEDTWNYYSAMNIFVLPSLFEGLPVVGIEAQSSGLDVLLADNITREVKINENVYYLPNQIDLWNEKINLISNAPSVSSRSDKNKYVAKTKFNINFLSNKLEKEYKELYLYER